MARVSEPSLSAAYPQILDAAATRAALMELASDPAGTKNHDIVAGADVEKTVIARPSRR